MSIQPNGSSVVIQQLGSTNASTGVAMSTLTAALAANSLDNTNFTQTWNWSTLGSGDGLVIESGSASATGSLLKFGITNASASGTALNITNAGTGLVLRLNDDGTYTDSTPVAVDSNGRLIIGNTNGLYDLTFGDNDTGIDWESDGRTSYRINGNEVFRLDTDFGGQGFQFNVTNALNGNACDAANEVLETTADGTLRCGSEDSDERLKNVYARNVLYGLDEILAAELIQYDWNEASGRANENGITRYQGFSAQNIESIAPELVFESFGGTYGVDQNGLIATAWNGIKQMNEKHEQFAAEIGAQIEAVTDNGAISGTALVTGLSLDFGDNTTLASAMNFLADKVGELDTRVTALEQVDPTVTNITNTTEQVTQNITQIIEDTKQYGAAKVLGGKIGVKVRFTTAYTTVPAVFVTPLNGSTYEVTDITTTGFTIRLSEAAGADKSFTWMAAEIEPGTDDGEQIDAPVSAPPSEETTPPEEPLVP